MWTSPISSEGWFFKSEFSIQPMVILKILASKCKIGRFSLKQSVTYVYLPNMDNMYMLTKFGQKHIFTKYGEIFIGIISTSSVSYSTPLVRYAHFVFTVYSQLIQLLEISRLQSWPKESSKAKCVIPVHGSPMPNQLGSYYNATSERSVSFIRSSYATIP